MSDDTVPRRLCFIDIGPNDDVSKKGLELRLTANFKTLLPEACTVYGALYITTGDIWCAQVVLEFKHESLWKQWVLKGFGECDESVEELWNDYGTYLFTVAAKNSNWNDRGWAATEKAENSGRKRKLCTPQHFFDYGEWHDGPAKVHEFLSAIERNFQGCTTFGKKFW